MNENKVVASELGVEHKACSLRQRPPLGQMGLGELNGMCRPHLVTSQDGNTGWNQPLCVGFWEMLDFLTWWDSYWIHYAEAEREHVEQTPYPDSERAHAHKNTPFKSGHPDLCSRLHLTQFSEKGFCLTCPF